MTKETDCSRNLTRGFYRNRRRPEGGGVGVDVDDTSVGVADIGIHCVRALAPVVEGLEAPYRLQQAHGTRSGGEVHDAGEQKPNETQLGSARLLAGNFRARARRTLPAPPVFTANLKLTRAAETSVSSRDLQQRKMGCARIL